MAGESSTVKRYRRKLVEQNKKMDFMTNLIMNRDTEIATLKRSIETLTAVDEEEIDAEQDGEGDREGSEDRPDLETSEGDS